MNNLFNTSAEPVAAVAGSVALYSGVWSPSPLLPPCNGLWKPLESGALNYGFRAQTNSLDPTNPQLINGTFIIDPAPCPAGCGNFSHGFAGFAFEMEPGGAAIDRAGAVTDDMYTELFVSAVGDEVIYTVNFRHKDCDPQGWSKCKACTCPNGAI